MWTLLTGYLLSNTFETGTVKLFGNKFNNKTLSIEENAVGWLFEEYTRVIYGIPAGKKFMLESDYRYQFLTQILIITKDMTLYTYSLLFLELGTFLALFLMFCFSSVKFYCPEEMSKKEVLIAFKTTKRFFEHSFKNPEIGIEKCLVYVYNNWSVDYSDIRFIVYFSFFIKNFFFNRYFVFDFFFLIKPFLIIILLIFNVFSIYWCFYLVYLYCLKRLSVKLSFLINIFAKKALFFLPLFFFSLCFLIESINIQNLTNENFFKEIFFKALPFFFGMYSVSDYYFLIEPFLINMLLIFDVFSVYWWFYLLLVCFSLCFSIESAVIPYLPDQNFFETLPFFFAKVLISDLFFSLEPLLINMLLIFDVFAVYWCFYLVYLYCLKRLSVKLCFFIYIFAKKALVYFPPLCFSLCLLIVIPNLTDESFFKALPFFFSRYLVFEFLSSLELFLINMLLIFNVFSVYWCFYLVYLYCLERFSVKLCFFIHILAKKALVYFLPVCFCLYFSIEATIM